MMENLPPDVVKAGNQAAPAIGGALTAALLGKGPLVARFTMFTVGAITAYFASEVALKLGEVSASTAAYLVGVFSPFIINKLLEEWDKFDLGAFLSRRLGKKEDK